jgi:hypothetical protein
MKRLAWPAHILPAHRNRDARAVIHVSADRHEITVYAHTFAAIAWQSMQNAMIVSFLETVLPQFRLN